MTIVCNAFPKMGTNLLKKTMGALGLTMVPGQMTRQRWSDALRVAKHPSLPMDVLSLPDNHYIHSHVCAPEPAYEHSKVIHISRHPRNATLSFLRWAEKNEKGPKYDKESMLNLLYHGAYNYGPWISAMWMFDGWREAALTPSLQCRILAVEFENICIDRAGTIHRIVDFLGYPHDKDAWIYKNLFGGGHEMEDIVVCPDKSTWSGKWSDWKTCPFWDDEVANAWRHLGGGDLERKMGYELE